jgi:voltage-gated potassium channel Kch
MHLEYEDWQTRYIYSIYWAVMTMSTVGYGDITAQNKYEALFSVFAMLFSSIIFAFCLNTIGLIINDFSSKKRKIENNFAIINRYMKKRNLKPDL